MREFTSSHHAAGSTVNYRITPVDQAADDPRDAVRTHVDLEDRSTVPWRRESPRHPRSRCRRGWHTHPEIHQLHKDHCIVYGLHMTLPTQSTLTIGQACKRLGITQVTMWRWRRDGIVQDVMVPGSTRPRIPAREVDRIKALPRDHKGLILDGAKK